MWYNQTCMFKSWTLEKGKPVRSTVFLEREVAIETGGKSHNSQASDAIWRVRWKVLGSDEVIGVGPAGGGAECHEWDANFWLEQSGDESGGDRKRSGDSYWTLLANCTTQKMKFQTLRCYSRAGHHPWPEIQVLLPSFQAAHVAALFFRILFW